MSTLHEPASDSSPENELDSGSKTDGRDTVKSARSRNDGHFNVRLLSITGAVIVGVLLLGVVSYFYQSGRTANTFKQRAESAREAGDYEQQAMWLDRYTLLRPDDFGAVVDLAIATDNAANSAQDYERYRLGEDARRQLGFALSQIPAHAEQAGRETEVRKRLIERLIEIGGGWYKEAERQLIRLNAPHDDKEAIRWLALSLVGQVKTDTLQQERNLDNNPDVSHWRWLAAQNYGDILQLAVKANPDNPTLAASFVDSFLNKPSAFGWAKRLVTPEQDDEANPSIVSAKQMIAALPNPELQIAALIEDLIGRVDNGHSQYIANRYYQHAGDEDRASEILSSASTYAIKRLETNLPKGENAESTGQEGTDTIDESQKRKIREQHSWDAMIVVEQAEELIRQDKVNDASDLFRRLTAIDHTDLPLDMVERAYLGYGHTWLLLGDATKASEVWKSGVESLKGEPLDLLRASASTLVYEGEDLAEALSALKRFSSAIDRANVRIARSAEDDFEGTSRQMLVKKVEVANWHLTVLRGKYAERRNAFETAISLMQKSLDSTTNVPNAMRARVATDLAALLSQRGLWDLAAAALDKAVIYNPDNLVLRDAAAKAWLRSGNRARSLKHRRDGETKISFRSLLASAEAQLSEQLKLLPSQRNLSSVRSIMRLASELLDKLAEAKPELRDEILSEVWRHKVLSAYLPPDGVSLDDHVRSQELADEIIRIAKSDPINQNLQGFAAVRLTAIKQKEAANECLDRLASIADADQSSVAMVKAAVASIDKRYKDAAVILVTRSSQDKPRKAELLIQAADYAVYGNEIELAYRAIESVPIEERDVSLLRKLSSLARALPKDSKVLTRDGRTTTALELSTKWESALRQAEGENGTYWRFSRASTLIVQAYQNPEQKATNEARIAEVEKLYNEISSRRPDWGPGIALGGWLAALKGEVDESINLLQRGIAAGDRRIQTRMLLVEQLNKLGRFEDAEMELQRAGQAIGAAPETMPQLAVELAQSQGDYNRSVAMARMSVESREKDPSARQLLAQTLSMAAAKARKPADKERFLTEARDQLRKAVELTDGPDFGLFASRLQFELVHGDRASQQNVLDEITASQLPEKQRMTLVGQAYVTQGDMKNAGKALERVAQLSPTDPKAQMNLAKFYQMTGDADKSIAAIETAYRLAPGDTKIRNQLALALALQGGADVPWDRLNQLLGGSSGVDGTAESRLLHGLLLAQRGGKDQQDQASEMLQELIDDGGERSTEATRLLASLNRLRWFQHPDRDTSEQAQGWLDQAKGLYELLVRRRDPQPIDLYRYADLLLTADQPHDVGRLLLSLESIDRAAVAALDISLRYNQTTAEPQPSDELITKWAEKASSKGSIEPEQLSRLTGYSLLHYGHSDKAIPLLEQAYNANSQNIVLLVRAFVQSGKSDRAKTICKKHYKQYQDATSATLLSEAILTGGVVSTPLAADLEETLNDAQRRYPTNAALLESIGTVRLQQQNYEEAVRLLELTTKIAPDRVRTLNNLAMAYSEIPGKAKSGIPPINRALENLPSNPELLDTKGVVLMKANDLPAAKAVFAEAIRLVDEPRFRFHMVMTLRMMGADEEARQHWNELDLKRLNPAALTADERTELEKITRDFSGKSVL